MGVFKSKVAVGSERFSDYQSAMMDKIEQMRALEKRSVDKSELRRPVFEKRGQLTPNDRLKRLLDPGMPFLRLFNMANYLWDDKNPDTSLPGGSSILGIGYVSGVRCLVWVDDSGIRAGAATTGGWQAARQAQEIAIRQKLPFIHLVESAGANLMEYEVELWANAGVIFRNLATMSAMGIPTLVVLHGPSTAGGAYMPGMSDYVVGVKNNGLAALAGAALVKAATGEVVDERELGGTEMHSSVSGVIEYLAEDDAHGIAIARDIIDGLGWNERADVTAARDFEPPKYDPETIAGAVPTEYTTPYDIREVMARLYDGSEFEEFKSRYGPATVCAQGRVMGMPCAMIGNNGPIDPSGATKAGQFFQLCDSADMPIVFLHNTTGYMVGTEYEQAGMIKHGSKMIQAVSNVRVPKISFYIGASFGAGNYGMNGFSYAPDFIFSWPNSRTGVMGGAQAAKTMRQVAEVRAQRKGVPLDIAAADKQQAEIEAIFERQESAFYSSGRALDHGMIDPRDTRKVLGFCLMTCREAKARDLKSNTFGVARL